MINTPASIKPGIFLLLVSTAFIGISFCIVWIARVSKELHDVRTTMREMIRIDSVQYHEQPQQQTTTTTDSSHFHTQELSPLTGSYRQPPIGVCVSCQVFGAVGRDGPMGPPGPVAIGRNGSTFRTFDGLGVAVDPIDFTRESFFYDDFVTDLSSAAGFFGLGWSGKMTGKNAVLTQSADVVQLSTGTTATGLAWMSLAPSVVQFGSGVVIAAFKVMVPVLSTTAQRYILRVGLTDNSIADPVNGIYMTYDSTNRGLNWFACTSQGSLRNELNTGVVVDAGTWYTVRITVSSDASQVLFQINNNDVGVSSTRIPSGSNQAVTANIGIIKSLGNVAHSAHLDSWMHHIVYNTHP